MEIYLNLNFICKEVCVIVVLDKTKKTTKLYHD